MRCKKLHSGRRLLKYTDRNRLPTKCLTRYKKYAKAHVHKKVQTKQNISHIYQREMTEKTMYYWSARVTSECQN